MEGGFVGDGAERAAGKEGCIVSRCCCQVGHSALRRVSLERLIEAHDGAATSLAFTLNGSGLVSGGADKRVRLWNVADGRLQRSYVGSNDGVTSVAVTPDGTRIAAGGLDKNVRIWPVAPPAQQNRRTELP